MRPSPLTSASLSSALMRFKVENGSSEAVEEEEEEKDNTTCRLPTEEDNPRSCFPNMQALTSEDMDLRQRCSIPATVAPVWCGYSKIVTRVKANDEGSDEIRGVDGPERRELAREHPRLTTTSTTSHGTGSCTVLTRVELAKVPVPTLTSVPQP